MTEVRRAGVSGAVAAKPSRGLLHHSLRKLAFRMGYNFSLRKIPQYDRERRALRVPHDMEPEFIALYKQARAGDILEFTGISAPYEEPQNPDLIIDTVEETVLESVYRLIDYVGEHFTLPGTVKKVA